MINSFVFDGISSRDYSIFVSGSGTFGSPERDVEMISIDGRNGDLVIDKGRWKNITVSYDCYMQHMLRENISAFQNFISKDSSYHQLQDTFHPEEFRMARCISSIDPKVMALRYGKFTIQFDCKPQRFLLSGENEIQLSAGTYTLHNPTLYDSKPEITVSAGTGTLVINNTTVTLNTNNGATVIDSDLEDCYEGSANRNSDLILKNDKFPTLSPGENSVVVGSGMTIKLKPRWYMV